MSIHFDPRKSFYLGRLSVPLVRMRLLISGILLGLLFWVGTLGAQTLLIDGQRQVVGKMRDNDWRRYRIYVNDWHSDLKLDLIPLAGNPDIYVRFESHPTLTNYDFRPYLDGEETVELSNFSEGPLRTGWYYIGVHSRPWRGRDLGEHGFVLTANRRSKASRIEGMGAKPFELGTSFRVWAPFAKSVHVAGDFNSWSNSNAPLAPEGNGYWSLEYRNANPGQRYKYVVRSGNQTLWRTDPYEEQVVNSVGDSVIFDDHFPWTDDKFQMPPWNELVIYEMHLGTFNDLPGGGPGTFDSASQRLDDLQSLGINAIKLMPVNEFAGDFSWGYNPSHPFAVESAYGGPRKLKDFVNQAHARGIAVILDVVHNHWGPSDLSLWRFDGWFEGSFGGIYFYQDNRSITPWGDTRPDYGRSEVRQYIRDNILMWLEDFHIDGLRVDSTLNIRRHNLGDNPEGWELLRWMNDEVKSRQPWKIMIAEDLQSNPSITRPTHLGGAGFDAQWTPAFVHPVREVLEASEDNQRNMFAIRNAIEHNYNGDRFQRVIYTESHDEVANGRTRVPEAIWPGNAASWFSRKRSTLGGVLVMTSPGIPMIFQGQEILQDGWFDDQVPIDWNRAITFAGIRQLYSDLIRLRRNWFDNTRGLRGQNVNVFHTNNQQKMLAFHRWDQGGPGDDVLVVLNFSHQPRTDYRIGLPRSGVWNVRFNSDWNGYSPDFDNFHTPDVTAQNIPWDGLNFSGVIRIAPYSAVILTQGSSSRFLPAESEISENPGLGEKFRDDVRSGHR
jgi:1,4-alpha-glucan branching enzyme